MVKRTQGGKVGDFFVFVLLVNFFSLKKLIFVFFCVFLPEENNFGIELKLQEEEK